MIDFKNVSKVYDNGTKRTEGAVKSLTVSAAELFDLD